MRTAVWEMRRLFYTYCNICKCSPLCTCVGSWGRHLFGIKLFSLFSQFNLFSLFSVRYFVQFAHFWRIFQHLTSFSSVPSTSSGRFSSIFYIDPFIIPRSSASGNLLVKFVCKSCTFGFKSKDMDLNRHFASLQSFLILTDDCQPRKWDRKMHIMERNIL